MSGHSKWHEIKRKKAAKDVQKGRIFSRCAREIMVAAREGGGNPDNNPRLRLAIQNARDAGMPGDNIIRAIKKGTGELEGEQLERQTYEGYGPYGVALLIDTLTDNRNRTVAELRRILSRAGGSMGEAGCVAWMFHPKGVIHIPRNGLDEDTVLEIVLEAGAEDMSISDDSFEIITAPEDYENVRQALEEGGIPLSSAEITMLPQTTIQLTEEQQARQILRLMDALEDQEDVQRIYANFDIPEDLMRRIEEETE